MEIQETKSGNVVVLSFKGRLDALTSQGAQDRINALLERGETKLVADVGQLEHIASAGLRVFMSAAKKLKTVNGKLVFCAVHPYTKELFDIAGFTSLFPIYATAQDAITALA